MLVKIIYWRVKKEEDGAVIYKDQEIEHIYDVNHYALSQSKTQEPLDVKKDRDRKEVEMNLFLYFNKTDSDGWDETITFPAEQEDQVVDIYIMNNQGRTVDRYSY